MVGFFLRKNLFFFFFRLCDFDMDVVKMFEQKEATECSDVQKNSLAVRKFPSYGWSREREARIKATLQQEKRAVSCPPTTQIMHTVDFPRFELSGLSETAPKEIEGNANALNLEMFAELIKLAFLGWFVSKIKLLRKLSEPSDLDPRKSPSSSRAGSVYSGSKKPLNGKVSVKVALDQDLAIMNDLADYLKELRKLNHIIDQIDEEHSNDADLNEVLKTAKKIEKASVSGNDLLFI